MTTALKLAEFVRETDYDDLSADVRDALKRRLLDAVGIAVPAEVAGPPQAVRRTVTALEDDGPCTLWGRDQRASPVGAAMHNTALVRYLDYMDSFLAPGETPHPSDNVAAVVAAAEFADRSGTDLLAGLAIAYEIQAELAWNAPVRERGFDHVTHTVVSAAAGASKVLELDLEETRSAIAIAATGHNALRVTRTGEINEWKGLASANAARNAVYAAMLAKHGVAGPRNVFEGQKGWQDVISGPFEVELTPGERVHDVMTKRYVAETYAQSAVEGVVELAEREDLDPAKVAGIKLETFGGAKLIIGGGEGNRYEVANRAQADHSLPYMLAVALIDRDLSLAQYDPDRIRRNDVQQLLRIVDVSEDPALTERFENGEMPAVIDVTMDDGTTYRVEKDAFRGHPTDPIGWDGLAEKFETVTDEFIDAERRDDIQALIRSIEDHKVTDLTALLA
ncbi:MmgE/PrpD family protein [Natrialba asiatica]|uniref:2-methylcitrate dehydratase n=1 Tax=Natrialba asiatica (strain ATCC 700177 / DSM 12278 / JCM 9576 / FERM P-10747 / NBRC 102637 / 172P1) TaxID=29540 RepID=M0AIL2_NATA1|nr:MmgE/PrpD family protein [Natrialba asiatica]ELY98505.1 2-methylcitrate dehydratase [Natrialba asiatica DSM 12278]